jgi:orotidine-5'-phosphate decarboxylase
MIKAKEAILYKNLKIKIIAVTLLTSLTEEYLKKEIKINDTMDNIVLSLATNAKKAGLDGVVCSAHEAAAIKANLGESFMTVCPGIRLLGSSSHDQQRIMTPAQAIASGADYLVMGRNITEAEDPKIFFQ